MLRIGRFPFGQPIHPVSQRDSGDKAVFVLGVYASAVHARWDAPGEMKGIRAVAVASEPEIFWRGSDAAEIIHRIRIPEGAGRLYPAAKNLNGPSGVALDEKFLEPLNLPRSKAWLCDLIPYSCQNSNQAKAIRERYRPVMKELGLPEPDWPSVPTQLSDEQRREDIKQELRRSKAKIIITLGDQPLTWFTKFYGSKSRLNDYGIERSTYGRLHPIEIGDQELELLPLVHPRQAGKLGSHSSEWADLHERWRKTTASRLLEKPD